MPKPQKLLHFDVLECLGMGARSTVYRVSDSGTHHIHALKHVVRSAARDIRYVQELRTEFRVSQGLTHPNVRRSHDLKIVRNWFGRATEAYLVMDYVQGQTLDAAPLRTTMDIIDAFIQIARGVKAIHERNLVYCGLRPSNVICGSGGVLKVIDLGHACPLGTAENRIQGSPDFMAPEQLSRRPVTVQTDVYSFGAMLYWCLTGKPIPTLFTVTKKGENSFLLENRIETPQDLNPQIPLPLSNLVMDCISVRPQKRPGDMDQVVTRLELARWQGGPGGAGQLSVLRPRGPGPGQSRQTIGE